MHDACFQRHQLAAINRCVIERISDSMMTFDCSRTIDRMGRDARSELLSPAPHYEDWLHAWATTSIMSSQP